MCVMCFACRDASVLHMPVRYGYVFERGNNDGDNDNGYDDDAR
jgi:hypothetical protein